ncbi:efflux RND transporter permease subunit [Halieaceae bacterium IMCC14734]|uniref:Efflux RND transporter permease subunit n=1 Tax=Candidatus Litorirhabdus singularis TaxID=2518993 RepID=A0ABT3TNW0_9GAMM|nr:efflux RND transporter permease subunit [Candidatus Litorirhabdus singularis]MCX2983069.1 efflux RND transporter permease subunit [Candidatus Litorirhabdus singularis]
MNLGEYSVNSKVISWLLVVIMVGGGVSAFESMGKLEDPAFTIKSAKIITQYPGASATEVQEELTYHIEDALQRMEQIKWIKMSVSRPGLSDILVDFKDQYKADDLPNIFDELRRKMADVAPNLPPGAMAPMVIDDFGDVYGVYTVLTGEGYSWRDLYDTADRIKRQLILVPGVRKVVIDGEQKEVVYVDISRSRMAELGIDIQAINRVLASQNEVVVAGNVRVNDDYLRISPTGAFKSVQAIGDVLISSQDKRLIYLRDIATITRAYDEVPSKIFYVNGKPGLSMGISMLSGENVVEVGRRLDQKVAELLPVIPVGMKMEVVYDQPKAVDSSVSGFITSVGQAVAIVIAVLLLFMGLRVGIIIGAVLLITVAGTLFVMNFFGIELQRISLGALVIALGMLVDNAIVVAEGMLVRMNKGMSAARAAGEAVGKTQWALLGGTLIGILAFSAIGLSPDNTGEFASSLFYVIMISLSLSWITAVSTTPLLCALLLKPGASGDEGSDPYGGGLFQAYRGVVASAVNHRWVTMAGVVVLFVMAVIGFGSVKSGFFPDSSTPMFFVDVWEPEGTDIRVTRDDSLRVSEYIRTLPGVVQTSAVIGGPHQRFTLVYDAKEPSRAYGQIIVETESRDQIPAMWTQVNNFMREEMPWLDPIVKPLRIGPGRDAKIEARFSGPDPQVLRRLADEAMAIMRADSESRDVREDWRSPVKVVTPVFNEQVGRQLGVTRDDLGSALQYAVEGTPVGTYRDGIRVLPIRVRAPEDERGDINNLRDIQVWSPVLGRAVPASQVVSSYETSWENAVIRGRDRMQTIIASCNPSGELATPLFTRLRAQIDEMPLPPGYKLAWGGEYEDSNNAQKGLGGALPVGFMLMILTSVFLFGKLRQPAIIWLTVPLAIIGITAGLLTTGGAFDFMSLLGALSLVGLLIKNAIVLIEEIDQQIEEGKDAYEAVLDSAVSRMRPVMLAASTTILGLIPLLSDVFFVNMSVTIMAGLGFASILTLIVVPTLYAIFFRIHRQPGH